MKKSFLFFFGILVAAMIMTACGSSNSSNSGNSSSNNSKESEGSLLVGKWKCEFAGEDGFIFLTLRDDGTGEMVEYDRGHIDYCEPITYFYDHSDQMYKIRIQDGPYTYNDPIVYISKKEILIKGDKEAEHYYRVE